jgi:hypothetical protein
MKRIDDTIQRIAPSVPQPIETCELDEVRGGFLPLLGALVGSAGSIMQGIESFRMHATNKRRMNAESALLEAQAAGHAGTAGQRAGQGFGGQGYGGQGYGGDVVQAGQGMDARSVSVEVRTC